VLQIPSLWVLPSRLSRSENSSIRKVEEIQATEEATSEKEAENED